MQKILQVQNLKITFPVQGKEVAAVNGLSFSLNQGEILGIVGESGCGKTLTALSLLRLIDAPGKISEGEAYYFGEIPNFSTNKPDISTAISKDVLRQEITAEIFAENLAAQGGNNLFQLSEEQMRRIRGNKIAMIFQEPMTSLNPVFTVGDQIIEAILLHQTVGKREARDLAIDMLRKVHIPDPSQRIDDYPHQMSGGMRQRVMIAMALSCKPDILIADEPTTALDVTIQAQILELIRELVKEMNMSVLMITHDLGVVAELCDQVMVMYNGQAVEKAPVKRLFERPKHPYTIGLMKSIPPLHNDHRHLLYTIPGNVPDLSKELEGCRFADRCPRVVPACRTRLPQLKYVGGRQEVRCINY